MSVQIGTQTITPIVKDMGNSFYIQFKVKINGYNGETVDENIDVKFVCNKYKTIMEGKPPNVTPKKVEKTLQECVDEFINTHSKIYTFS